MKNSTAHSFVFALFCLAWLGIWGAWLPGKSASLNQHAVDLAEWSTFLLDVRSGEIRYMPDVLRLSLALSIIGVIISARSIPSLSLRWLIRLSVLLPTVMMLPPYPDVLRLWFSDSYGLRFTVSTLPFIAVVLSFFTDRLNLNQRLWVLMAISGLALGAGTWSYLLLRRPYTVHLGENFGPGWGTILFGVGLLGIIAIQITQLLSQREAHATQP